MHPFIHPSTHRAGTLNQHFTTTSTTITSSTTSRLGAVAFLLAAVVQARIDAAGEEGTVSFLWQVPQYVTITAGEVLFSVTGLEFAFKSAPDSMKSVVQRAGRCNCRCCCGNAAG